jgi:hypothetical protein
MFAACLLIWCLGDRIDTPQGFTFANDIRDNGRTERIVAYESQWLVLGGVEQTTERNAVFAGSLPLKINLFGNRLMIAGGAIAASASVPGAGTHANFLARAQIRILDRVSIAYWHFSNGNLGKRNPSVDSVGVTVQLRR